MAKKPAPQQRRSSLARFAPFVIVAIVLCIAAGGAYALYQRHKPSPLGIAGIRGAEPPHVRGSRGPVVVEEFGDFQCPPCGILSGIFDQLEKEMPNQFRLVFRNYPLVVHKNAVPAANAAEAAGLQGKYWQMHHLLYETQKSWAEVADPSQIFEQTAAKAGCDVARFKTDFRGEQVKARVAEDQKRATSFGVDRTPTVFVNNKRVAFTQVKPEVFRDAIKAAAEKK